MNKSFQKLVFICCTVFASSALVAEEFQLSSNKVPANSILTDEQVFAGFGCTGKNLSPDLQWTPGPAGTQSYAVTVYDPDAPTGSGWWHWIVYNIPGNVTSLAAGAGVADSKLLPAGASQGRSDYGTYAFGGACPPAGDAPHRYVFSVYALKVNKIDVPVDASAALIGFMLNANDLAKASFTANYAR